MDFATFLIQTLNSLQYGLLLFLVASGLILWLTQLRYMKLSVLAKIEEVLSKHLIDDIIFFLSKK